MADARITEVREAMFLVREEAMPEGYYNLKMSMFPDGSGKFEWIGEEESKYLMRFRAEAGELGPLGVLNRVLGKVRAKKAKAKQEQSLRALEECVKGLAPGKYILGEGSIVVSLNIVEEDMPD